MIRKGFPSFLVILGISAGCFILCVLLLNWCVAFEPQSKSGTWNVSMYSQPFTSWESVTQVEVTSRYNGAVSFLDKSGERVVIYGPAIVVTKQEK